EWLTAIKKCQFLSETDMKKLCEMVKDLLMEESNIQPVHTPVTVCGDIHGQFYDLLELFHVGGEIPETHYIFMIVDGRILCVHGGLSPEVRTLDQIRTIPRAQEIPHEGAFCDLMWSDPEDIDTWAVSPRGAGWLFGAKVTNEVNDLNLIARAHQLVQEGYKYMFPDDNLVTVWSAPNYCYRCGNVASIMAINENLQIDESSFKIFNAVPDQERSIPQRAG
ncbi:10565_t:CDS:2, partial [Cetraspora pellucida]